MKAWSKTSLEELVSIKHGYAFKGEFFTETPSNNILLTPGNFAIGGGFQFKKMKYYDGPIPEDYVLSVGDLLVTMTDLSKEADTLGYSAIVPNDNKIFLHNQRLGKVIRKNEKVSLSFLHWLMRTQSYRNEVLGSRTGSTVKHTSPSRILNFRFSIPPEMERERICNILDSLNDKIELNRQINTTLEAMAQAIFKDWFVDFGPTVRKAEGETDPVKILGGLIPDPAKAAPIADFFPDSFDDEGLPQGWSKQTLKDIVDLNYGKSLPKKTRVAGEFSVYGSGGVTGSHNDFLVKGPSIIIGRKGTVGSLYWEPNNFFPIDTVFYVVPKNAYTLSFIWPLLQTLGLNKMNTDAAVPGLNRNNAYRLEIPKPSNEVLQAFEKIVFPLRQKIDANDKENQSLTETRDYLLPKLMSGEVRVGEATPAATVETSKVVTMGGDLFDRKVLPADKDLERDSAIVAGVVSALQKDTEVVGNVKYQKGCYFVYRRMGYSTRDFDRKAAGPYSRKIVEGGHARAVSQNYIRIKSDPKYPGNLPARNISVANALANQYKLGDAFAWVRQHLSGKSRGELELWATVDYTMVALRNRRTTPTTETIMDYIRNEPEWVRS